jgi:hypothetical protein
MSDKQDKPADPANLFGPPPLLHGEDEALYFALQSEVESLIQPENILDRADVRDIADKIWEGHRYKRLEARLIESARVSALAHILAPTFGLNHQKAFEAANMYYGRDPAKRKLAAGLLAHYNITEEMIHAKALAQSSGAIAYIDRMINSRQVTRNRLFSDNTRRREGSPKANRSPVRSARLPAPSDQQTHTLS